MPSIDQDIKIRVEETAPAVIASDEHVQVFVTNANDIVGSNGEPQLITVNSENYSSAVITNSETDKYCRSFFAQTYRPNYLRIAGISSSATGGKLTTGELIPPETLMEHYVDDSRSTPAVLKTGKLRSWEDIFNNGEYKNLKYEYIAGKLTTGTLDSFADFFQKYEPREVHTSAFLISGDLPNWSVVQELMLNVNSVFPIIMTGNLLDWDDFVDKLSPADRIEFSILVKTNGHVLRYEYNISLSENGITSYTSLANHLNHIHDDIAISFFNNKDFNVLAFMYDNIEPTKMSNLISKESNSAFMLRGTDSTDAMNKMSVGYLCCPRLITAELSTFAKFKRDFLLRYQNLGEYDEARFSIDLNGDNLTFAVPKAYVEESSDYEGFLDRLNTTLRPQNIDCYFHEDNRLMFMPKVRPFDTNPNYIGNGATLSFLESNDAVDIASLLKGTEATGAQLYEGRDFSRCRDIKFTLAVSSPSREREVINFSEATYPKVFDNGYEGLVRFLSAKLKKYGINVLFDEDDNAIVFFTEAKGDGATLGFMEFTGTFFNFPRLIKCDSETPDVILEQGKSRIEYPAIKFGISVGTLESETPDQTRIIFNIPSESVQSYADIVSKMQNTTAENSAIYARDIINISYNSNSNAIEITTREGRVPSAHVGYFISLDELDSANNLKGTAENGAIVDVGRNVPYRNTMNFSLSVSGETIDFSIPLYDEDSNPNIMNYKRFVELANQDTMGQVSVAYNESENILTFTSTSVGRNANIGYLDSLDLTNAILAGTESTGASIDEAVDNRQYKDIVFSFTSSGQDYRINVSVDAEEAIPQIYNIIISKINSEADNNIIASVVNNRIVLQTKGVGSIAGAVSYLVSGDDGLFSAEMLRGTLSTGAAIQVARDALPSRYIIPAAKRIMDKNNVDPIIITFSREFITFNNTTSSDMILSITEGFNSVFGQVNKNNTSIIIDTDVVLLRDQLGNTTYPLSGIVNSDNSRNIIVNYVPTDLIGQYLCAAVAARYTSVNYDDNDAVIPAKGLKFNLPIVPYNIDDTQDTWLSNCHANAYTTMSNGRVMYREGMTCSLSNFRWIELSIGVNVLVRRLKDKIFSLIGNPQFKVNNNGVGILKNVCTAVLNQFVLNGFLMDNVVDGKSVPAFEIYVPEVKKGILDRTMPTAHIVLHCTQFAYKVNLRITEAEGAINIDAQ